jgi:hypothetical protein
MGTMDQKREKKEEVKDENTVVPEDNQATNIIKHNNIKTKRSWLDWAQDALVLAGTMPIIGNVADVANVAISGGRAAHAAFTGGDTKRYLGDMALNAAAAIPAVGQGVAGARIAAKVGNKALKFGNVANRAKKMKTGSKYILATAPSPENTDKYGI